MPQAHRAHRMQRAADRRNEREDCLPHSGQGGRPHLSARRTHRVRGHEQQVPDRRRRQHHLQVDSVTVCLQAMIILSMFKPKLDNPVYYYPKLMVWGSLGEGFTDDKMRLFMPFDDCVDEDSGVDITYLRYQFDYPKIGMEIIDKQLFVDDAQFMCDIHRIYLIGEGDIHIYIIPTLLRPDRIFYVNPKDAKAHYQAYNTKVVTLRHSGKRKRATRKEERDGRHRQGAVPGDADRNPESGSVGDVLTRGHQESEDLLDPGQPMENVQEP